MNLVKEKNACLTIKTVYSNDTVYMYNRVKFGMKKHGHTIVLTLFFLVSVVLTLVLSQNGVGNAPDSILYLGVAHNMATNHTMTVPFGVWMNETITHYPPGYPALIATFSRLTGTTVLLAARLLNAILISTLIVLTIWSVSRLRQKNQFLSYIGGLILLTSIPLTSYAITASSEVAMLAFGLVSCITAYLYQKTKKCLYLVLCVVCLWLTTLTRYAGIAYLGAISIYFLFFTRPARQTRWITLGAMILAALPITLWVVKTTHVNGRLMDRVMLYHGTPLPTLARNVFVGIGAWTNQQHDLFSFGALVLLVIIFCLFLYQKRTTKIQKIQHHAFLLMLLFSLTYLATIGISLFFFDAALFSDPTRMLIPLLVPSILFLTGVVDTKKEWENSLLVRACVVGATIAYLLLFTTWATNTVKNGIGYATPGWKNASIFPIVSRTHPQSLLYSNSPHLLFLYTTRYAHELPIKYSMTSKEQNQTYKEEMDEMMTQMARNNGYLVYFKNVSGQRLASLEELTKIPEFYTITETPEAILFGYK